MQTITLKVADDVSDKFLWFLKHFSQDEIEILENSSFEKDYESFDTKKKLIQSQEASLARDWNNHYDEAWDEI